MRTSTRRLIPPGLGLIIVTLGGAAIATGMVRDGTGHAVREPESETRPDTMGARRLATLSIFPWDISPDGRQVIVNDWGTWELATLDLRTGEVRPITHGGGPGPSGQYSYGGSGLFSPDGSRVAYSWVAEGCAMEVRVIEPGSGRDPTVVLPCRENLEYYSPWDWTPDGAGVLVTFTLEGAHQMARLDVRDGSLSEIATFSSETRISRPKYTPDGRYVVFGVERPGSSGVDLHAQPVGGGADRILTEASGDEYLFGWESGGAALLYYRTDGLDSGLYRLPVHDGRPAGEPELLRRDLWRAVPLGQVSDGFTYLVTVEQRQVHTSSLDLGEGRQLTPFAPVEDPSVGSSVGGAWSPDGRSLAYVRSFEGDASLVVLGVEDGEAREYPFPLDDGGVPMAWSSDGHSLVAYGSADGQGWGVFRIDLRSGEATALVLRNDADLGSDWRTLSFGPEGRRLVVGNAGAGEDEIRVIDLDTGRSTLVTRAEKVWRTAVSPNGDRLAYWSGSGTAALHVVSMSGGALEAVSVEPEGIPWGLEWTPDGQHVIWAEGHTLWRVSVAGGEPEPIAGQISCSTGYIHLRLSPDGRRVSCNGGEWRGEVWLLEPGEGS